MDGQSIRHLLPPLDDWFTSPFLLDEQYSPILDLIFFNYPISLPGFLVLRSLGTMSLVQGGLINRCTPALGHCEMAIFNFCCHIYKVSKEAITYPKNKKG